MKPSLLVLFLIKRYLRFNKRQPFISIAALLAFLGVCVGVMVLIVAMALMNGFDKDFERKLFVLNYPLTILPIQSPLNKQDLQNLQSHFPNLQFSPFLYTQAIAKTSNSLESVVIFGVDFEKEKKLNPIFHTAYSNLNTHYLEHFGQPYQKGTFDIIIGSALKSSALLSPQSPLTLIFTHLYPNGLGLNPVIKRFVVVGDFHSGLLNYDKAYVFANIEGLARIKNLPNNQFDGIHVYSKNPMQDIKAIQATLPHAKVIGWWEQNANFFSALAFEKRILFIVLMLIILVASLNIISSLLMNVMNRRKEIALLLTMGASKKEIQQTFFYLGQCIGISGIILGCILAAIVLFVLSSFPIISLPEDVYGSTKLPLELSWLDFLMILLGSLVIVFCSSYYPSKKATQIDPLEVLRNE